MPIKLKEETQFHEELKTLKIFITTSKLLKFNHIRNIRNIRTYKIFRNFSYYDRYFDYC